MKARGKESGGGNKEPDGFLPTPQFSSGKKTSFLQHCNTHLWILNDWPFGFPCCECQSQQLIKYRSSDEKSMNNSLITILMKPGKHVHIDVGNRGKSTEDTLDLGKGRAASCTCIRIYIASTSASHLHIPICFHIHILICILPPKLARTGVRGMPERA